MTMNAFHPDYVKTHMPKFISTIRSEEQAKLNGQKFGSVSRQRQSVPNEPNYAAIMSFPKTKAVGK